MRRTKMGRGIWGGGILALACLLSTGTVEAYDGMSSFRRVAESTGGLIVSVRFVYDTKNGDDVWVRAIPLTSSGAEVYSVGCVAWPLRRGYGYAYLQLGYTGAGTISTSRIRVFFERKEGSNSVRFSTLDFPLTKSWTAQSDWISSSLRTRSQTPRQLQMDVTYTLRSTHAVSVRIQAQPLSSGLPASSFGYSPSSPLVAGSYRTASTTSSYFGSSTPRTDAMLLVMYEGGGSAFAYAVAPRVKYWSYSTTDSDSDSISDACETAIGANTRSRDTDGDGLEDGWELEGYRYDGYQYADSNLPLLGANARRRDVFIEVDYLSGTGHDHRLPPASVHEAKDLYAVLAIYNHDLTTGLTLHILHNERIAYDGDLGGVAGMSRYLSYFPARKRRIYHWAIAGHGTGGQGYVVGNWFVFGTGMGNPYGGGMSDYDQFVGFAVFVHELGHNLGLQHEGRSGTAQSNCKPNYPSLMNYAYDYAFNCSAYSLAETQIQFSLGNSPSISEGSLRETGTTGLSFVKSYDSDFLGCNLFRVYGSSIDWNRDGVYSATAVSVDCDALAPSCCRSDSAGNCVSGDGLKSSQRDSNDLLTIATYIDDSIISAASATAAPRPSAEGSLYDQDLPNLQPVCGIPAYGTLDRHPWLQVNPVFRLEPGMEILHPAMRYFLAPALDSNNRVRADAPIEWAPDPDPWVFDAPVQIDEGWAGSETDPTK